MHLQYEYAQYSNFQVLLINVPKEVATAVKTTAESHFREVQAGSVAMYKYSTVSKEISYLYQLKKTMSNVNFKSPVKKTGNTVHTYKKNNLAFIKISIIPDLLRLGLVNFLRFFLFFKDSLNLNCLVAT